MTVHGLELTEISMVKSLLTVTVSVGVNCQVMLTFLNYVYVVNLSLQPE